MRFQNGIYNAVIRSSGVFEIVHVVGVWFTTWEGESWNPNWNHVSQIRIVGRKG